MKVVLRLVLLLVPLAGVAPIAEAQEAKVHRVGVIRIRADQVIQ